MPPRSAARYVRVAVNTKRVVLTVCGLLLAVPLLALWQRHTLFRHATGLPAFTSADFTTETVWVTMRDGVKLHTELFLPADLEKAPVVLVRNPYQTLRSIERVQCGALARLGYACVLQDVRGQLDSEGEWYPIIHEREDGLDTLAWLTKQPWQDGHIGMRGPSYLTCVQWAMADELPPEVKTLVPSMFGTDLRQVFYERGLFRHDLLTAWATLMPQRGMNYTAGYRYLEAAAHRPALEADEKFMGQRVTWYRDLLHAASPTHDFWFTPQMTTLRAAPEKTRVPMLFLAGFFEPFFATHLDAWQRSATKDQSVFVVAPLNHVAMVSGDSDTAAPGRLDHWPLMLEWFDHHLKGRPLRTLTPGTVKLWGVGDDAWRTLPDWPPPAPTVMSWPLGRPRDSNTCEGGSLGFIDRAESVDFTFDPANPVPTRGGASLLSFVFFRYLGLTPGPLAQRPEDSCLRDDVLTFRSEPVATAQRLSGAAKLKLEVSSSAPDTAFVARLIAEADGKALLVREAAATLAWPDAQATEPRETPPGTKVLLELDFWPIDWELPAGGRWRLDVTSSSFPALHVHSNRATPWETEPGFDVAKQTVYFGPSQLELPLGAP